MTFRPGRQARKETYFNCQTWEDQPRLSESSYYEKLKATFDRILPRHLNGTERIAMSVTGGLDSRIIMAWARRQPSPCRATAIEASFASARTPGSDGESRKPVSNRIGRLP